MSRPILRARIRSPQAIAASMSSMLRSSAAQQARALPFIESSADRLTAYAEIGGDVLLGDLARKPHAIALGDADIGGELPQPVGEQRVRMASRLVVLLFKCGEQALRADADQPGAEHLVGLDQRP